MNCLADGTSAGGDGIIRCYVGFEPSGKAHIGWKVLSLQLKRMLDADANVLIMGLTFKENCPDLRNTRVIDLVSEFENFNCNVDVYDPWVSKDEAVHEYNIKPISKLSKKRLHDTMI